MWNDSISNSIDYYEDSTKMKKNPITIFITISFDQINKDLQERNKDVEEVKNIRTQSLQIKMTQTIPRFFEPIRHNCQIYCHDKITMVIETRIGP